MPLAIVLKVQFHLILSYFSRPFLRAIMSEIPPDLSLTILLSQLLFDCYSGADSSGAGKAFKACNRHRLSYMHLCGVLALAPLVATYILT